ncbi:unnamed protein product [Effrenium voratum]|nr:unnamed protein product [Effrenium voratum]
MLAPLKARTQIGGLVFGKDEEPMPRAPPAPESLVFPKPLPWLEPAGDLTMSPKHAVQMDVENRPMARIDALERRLEGRDSQAVRKLEDDVQLLRKVFEEQNMVESHRLKMLETQSQQSQLQEAMLREQVMALQAELRDFSGRSLRQLAGHAEVEGQVAQVLAHQRNSAEEWRQAMRQKDAQVQAELEMLSGSVEDLREKLLATQGELRVRLTALEIPMRSSDGGTGGVDGGYLAQSVEFLQQHMDKLQQGSIQAGAALSELHARLEGESAARAAAQQEHGSRLEALNQALGFSRALMTQSIGQRVEALEERLGVERKELFARHLRLRDEVSNEGQEGSARLQGLSERVSSALDALEQRCASVEKGHTELDARVADAARIYRSEGGMIKTALSAMSRRSEEVSARQSEAFKGFKAEVEATLRQLGETLDAERRTRLQDEKRIEEEVTEAARRAIGTEVAALQNAFKKQAETVVIELDRIRKVNADRADRLSRYVDAALSDAGVHPGSARESAADGRLLRDLKEQVANLQKGFAQQVQAWEHKTSEVAEELRGKLMRAADVQEDEGKALRREAEKAAREVERRFLSRQEELENRFENYVRHFDNAINSIQAAVLRPWQSELGASPRRGAHSKEPPSPADPGGGGGPSDPGSPGGPAEPSPPVRHADRPTTRGLPEDGAGQARDPVTEQVLASLWRHAAMQNPDPTET